ncbi:phage capsid protein [Paenibacillus albidus]|uniref:phage minor capsid protein n=1 Tax=Paenibacillus albidus TaxID=2041023 RepID=UPI001BEAF367|nr:phage minor capsid protein [Paenibacillus albidus]MBT2287985.1 phage capsid protein [Paenibacillus albidus]
MSKRAYDLRGIYSQMETDLIASMKRNLKRHENDEKKEGFEWDQWQEKKLQDLKQYRIEASRIVRKAAPVIEATVDQEVKGAFRRGAERVGGLFKRLINKVIPGRQKPLEVPGVSDDNFFKANEHRVNSLASAAQGELRAANKAILRQTDDVFRQTIFKSQVYMNSGAASLNQAIDMATKDFLDKGLDCITYKDGRRVNVASYSEMVLRASSQRAAFAGEGAKRQELGNPFVLVSAHSNCSELCLPWQGKVYIDDVYSGGKASDGPYPLLSTAMANGLFHPNCRHNMTTFIPGKSRLPEPVDDAKALASYKQEHRQRYMERQVRKYKRREAGSVDPNNQAAAAAKVKQWQGKLHSHMKANPELRRDTNREKILGGISQAEHNELLKLAAKNAKIKETRAHIRSDAQPKKILTGQQNKHVPGTKEYQDYQKRLDQKGQHGPSYLTIPPEKMEELVQQHAGTGNINLRKGEWDHKETILTNDGVVGKAVNNLTGAEAETTVFAIHYAKAGVHIVPDYPSKKKGKKSDD